MPLYEYQCDACGHRFEKIQKFSDPPEDTCPTCRGTLRKLASAPAFQLKGTGWYATDYGKKDTGGVAAADAGGKDEKPAASDKDKAEKSEKSEKSDKTDKSEKSTAPTPPAAPSDTKTGS